MDELKKALRAASTLSKINDIMQIAVDSLTGLTAEEIAELNAIATEKKQVLYNSRYIKA